jgi:carbamoyl-phosphate synthase large subunit
MWEAAVLPPPELLPGPKAARFERPRLPVPPARLTLAARDVPAGAVAVEADALFDGTNLALASVGEALDAHGGRERGWPDTGVLIPALSLGEQTLAALRARSIELAAQLGVRGPLRLRFALANDELIPVSVLPTAGPGLTCADKRYGAAAALVRLGASIGELRADGLLPRQEPAPATLPTTVWIDGADGVATGVADSVGAAYALARAASGDPLPRHGAVAVALRGRELRSALPPLHRLVQLGFRLLVETGHLAALRRYGIDCTRSRGEPVVLRLRSAAGAAVAVQGIEAARQR